MTKRPVNIHDAYHAHVYFDETSVDYAEQLCRKAGVLFNLEVGRVHRRPIGPHTRWSCQILFTHQDFDQLIPWLDEHRNGLDILVHGLTDDVIEAHTTYAYWLGNEVDIDLSIFQKMMG